jgi:DNA-binding NarL/FixJ family response regulator
MTRTKVLIVDDHPLVREGLVARITSQTDLEICGEAADVDEALALMESAKPELVIVDLMLKTGHGLDLVKKTHQRYPDTKVLVVSAHDEALFAERALRAGAIGYVNKQEAQERVIVAILAALRGERFISDEMARRLIGKAIGDTGEQTAVGSLTDREIQILELIGRGKSTRAIAEELHLSIHTIETHRENMRAKLHLRTGSELARFAVQWVLESRSGS